jgi:hypothetical protein
MKLFRRKSKTTESLGSDDTGDDCALALGSNSENIITNDIRAQQTLYHTAEKRAIRKADTIVLGPMVKANLQKPLGIVLEENEIIDIAGGAHIYKVRPGGAADQCGLLSVGMILVEACHQNCRLLDFDSIMDILKNAPTDHSLSLVFATPDPVTHHKLVHEDASNMTVTEQSTHQDVSCGVSAGSSRGAAPRLLTKEAPSVSRCNDSENPISPTTVLVDKVNKKSSMSRSLLEASADDEDD